MTRNERSDESPSDANRTDANRTDATSRRDEVAASSTTRRTALKTIGATAGLLATGQAAGGVPTPRLHTDGKWIKDPSGNRVKPRGVAPADPGFYARSWHPKSAEEVLEWATDERRGWHPNHVRLPCTQDSVDHHGGIDAFVTDILRPAVDLLATRDVYALVDFHLIRPYTQAATETYNQNNSDALAPIDDVMRTFWNRVAPEFAGDEHVIFELFNEPTEPTHYGDDQAAWSEWKTAAQPWVDLVQSHAPATPLVIGSPRWTSVTHMAAQDPFAGDNLIYAGHVYPANGAPSEFDSTYGQPASDVPVWITEFGWDPDGGSVDQGTTTGWGSNFRQWVEGYQNVGWSAWCFDDSWAPTMFSSPGSDASEPWTLKDGTDQEGGYIKQWLADTRNDMIPESQVDDSTAPPAPSNLALDAATEVSVDVSWDPVTDEGEAGLSHYLVSLDGSFDQEVAAGTATATVTGLDPTTTYEVGVAAVDDAGNQSAVTTLVVETRARDAGQSAYDGPHSLPGRVEAENFDEGGQGLSYYDSSPDNQGGASYRDAAVDVGTSANTGYNVGYITDGEWLEYTIQVPSGGGSFVTRVNVATGNSQGGSLRIDLDGETLATQSVWNTGGWSSWQAIRVGSLDLSAGEHLLRVTAESGSWNFDWIEFEGDGSGGDTTAPTAPSNLISPAQTQTSVDLSWDAATDSGGSGLDHYAVSVDGTLDHTVVAGTTSTTVDELSADTSYQMGVSAVDGAGNESPETTLSVTTQSASDGQAPSAPSSLTVSSTTSSSVTVDWDAASDSGGSGLDHYAVSLNGSQGQTVSAGTTSATVDGLSAGTNYSVGVAAVDGAGNESATTTVTATTSDGTTNAMLVNDYDGSPSWSSNQNDLGQWCGAGSFQNGGGEVVDGALRLEYDNGGWLQEQINQDVSEYSTLVLRVSGANGGEESEVLFDMGGVRTMLSNVTSDGIGTSAGDVVVDLESAGVDRTSSSLSVRLNFWQGGSSTLEIEEIRLE